MEIFLGVIVGGTVLAGVFFLILLYFPDKQYKSPLQQKKEDYTNALTALRADPTNPALH